MLMDHLVGGSDGAAPDYLTKKEVAERLRRTTRTIEHWMRLRKLPCFKINGQVTFHWPSVERHLQEHYAVTSAAERVPLGPRQGKQQR